MRHMMIKFTTSMRDPARPLFFARKRLFMKGAHQLSVRWMSTWYRVKGDKYHGFYVNLDEPVNGNRIALIKKDPESRNYVVQDNNIFENIDELKSFLEKDTSNEDFEIISIR